MFSATDMLPVATEKPEIPVSEWSIQVADKEQLSGSMIELQNLRIAVVTLLCQQNSVLLSRRQRVAGKEIDVLCAERDLVGAADLAPLQAALAQTLLEQKAAQQQVAETEQELAKLESVLAQINADISALCQS